MMRLLRFTGILVLLTVFGISTYYVYTVQEARRYTHGFVLPDLDNGQWRSPDGTIDKFDITSQDLAERQIEILVEVQDPSFYHHNGIDLATPGAGLTTITQSVVKKLYFHPFRPGIAKIRQSLIARFVVDDLITKEDQLTLFLNVMYLGTVEGKPVVGLESAADAYYNLTVAELSESQYISLIAMLVMPGTFSLVDHYDWNLDRSSRIKALISGEYEPTGLMDQFYGELPQEVIDSGLPPASYMK